jgi:hypothetical protein
VTQVPARFLLWFFSVHVICIFEVLDAVQNMDFGLCRLGCNQRRLTTLMHMPHQHHQVSEPMLRNLSLVNVMINDVGLSGPVKLVLCFTRSVFLFSMMDIVDAS